MQKKGHVFERISFERKRRVVYKKGRARLLSLRKGRVYKGRPLTTLLRVLPRWGVSERFPSRNHPLTQFEQGALTSYELAKARRPVEAYRLAQRVLMRQPHLAPLVACTALVLAQDVVPLEGLDLIEQLLSLEYALPQLVRAYARMLGSQGYHQEALSALRKFWRCV